MRRPQIPAAVCLAALLSAGPGCLFRTRTVEMRTSTAKLQTATKQELVDRINRDASQIKTLNATVEIAPSVGGEKKGKVTDYQEITGYILVRKPDMLRMIGLFPIVRNKAFDMVSDGARCWKSTPKPWWTRRQRNWFSSRIMSSTLSAAPTLAAAGTCTARSYRSEERR